MTNQSILGGTAAILAFSITTACSTATTTGAPRVVPFATTTDASSSPCRVTGRPIVVATRVFVPRGVEARVHEGGFEVRFAMTARRCLGVDMGSARDDVREAPCPVLSGASNAIAEVETANTSRTDVAADRSLLGIAVTTSPARGSEAGGAPGRGALQVLLGGVVDPGTPDRAAIGGGRFLRLSVEGGYERHQLRAQVFADRGDAMGSSFDISPPEGSVIGHASAIFDANGEGLVAYLASTDVELDVLATPVACTMR
jgi:hypothetical protein